MLLVKHHAKNQNFSLLKEESSFVSTSAQAKDNVNVNCFEKYDWKVEQIYKCIIRVCCTLPKVSFYFYIIITS